MTDLKSQTLPEMTAFLQSLGEPAFRGKQVFTWLHRGVTDFDGMTNLSKPLREKLKETCFITSPKVARKQVSRLDEAEYVGHVVADHRVRACLLYTSRCV